MPINALIMFATGIGIPVLAALNASLGARIGSPAAAASVLFVVAFSVAAVATLVTGPGALKLVPQQPKHLFLAGLCVAFYVLSVTYIAPSMGVGNAIFFVLVGQLVAAAVIDQWGLFDARAAPISPQRALGIACMVLGVWLTQRA